MQQARQTSPHINFKQERNFSEKLNATFTFLSQNFKPMALNLLFIAGPFALLAGISYGVYQSYVLNGAFMAENPFGAAANSSLIISSILLMMLFSLISGTLVAAIVFRHIKHYMEEGHAHIGTAYLWNSIWKEFFSILGTSFFIWIGVFLISMLVVLPIIILGVTNANPVLIGLSVFGLMIGFFFLIPALLLLYPIRSMEKKGVFEATSRMFRLISGKWLSTLGLVIVSFILQSIMAMVFALPMYITMFFRMLHSEDTVLEGTENAGSLYQILLSVSSGISMVGAYGLYSILFIAITFQYFNLVERKESSGLLERMESFGKMQPVNEDHEEQY